MSFTTDPNDPRLDRTVNPNPAPPNEVYLILSEEERRKGFVRPVRRSYIHVGVVPKYPTRKLTEEEQTRYAGLGYELFEEYPESESPLTGMFWTKERLDAKVCMATTTMSEELCETYARDPKFYGYTYCATCRKHLPVAEFRWREDGAEVGS